MFNPCNANNPEIESVTCRTLRLQIAGVKNDITGMEKVWKDMDEDYIHTKNIAMGVLDRLDFQFEDVKRAVEELKREAKRIERFLKNRSKNQNKGYEESIRLHDRPIVEMFL